MRAVNALPFLLAPLLLSACAKTPAPTTGTPVEDFAGLSAVINKGPDVALALIGPATLDRREGPSLISIIIRPRAAARPSRNMPMPGFPMGVTSRPANASASFGKPGRHLEDAGSPTGPDPPDSLLTAQRAASATTASSSPRCARTAPSNSGCPLFPAA